MTPNPTHRTRLARALADATGISYQMALSLVAGAAAEGVLPEQLDPPGMQRALGLLQQRAGTGRPARARALEPRYYRLTEVVRGRVRPGVAQRLARAQATAVAPARSWGDYDPHGMDHAGGIVTVAGGRGTDWWLRVKAAGARSDCILPDPYWQHRSPDGAVPVDRALDERDRTGDLKLYETRLKDILRREPRDVDAWAHLGSLYLYMADDANWTIPLDDERQRRSWLHTALGHYQAGVGIAELALPDPFTGFLRHGHLDNRPFGRAIFGAAVALWRLGRLDEAEQTLLNMLWLNPEDNAGARLLLPTVRDHVRWEDADL